MINSKDTVLEVGKVHYVIFSSVALYIRYRIARWLSLGACRWMYIISPQSLKPWLHGS